MIELVMTIIIIAVVAAIFASVISTGFNSWFYMKNQRKASSDVALAIRQMAREVKLASPSNITVMTATQFTFNDINNNSITYQQTGTNLTRNAVTLLTGLSVSGGLVLTYKDKNGAVTATAANVRYVNISVLVQSGNNRVRLQTGAALREQ